MNATTAPVPSARDLGVLAEAIALVGSDVDELTRAVKDHAELDDEEVGRLLLFVVELEQASAILQGEAKTLRDLIEDIALNGARSRMPGREALAEWLTKRGGEV